MLFRIHRPSGWIIGMLSTLTGLTPAFALPTDKKTAEQLIQAADCINGKNIEQALKDKINIYSQRDLGWQVFEENGGYEVERVFLVNKNMQIRFRWRINVDNSIVPVSGRAESLCSEKPND